MKLWTIYSTVSGRREDLATEKAATAEEAIAKFLSYEQLCGRYLSCTASMFNARKAR